MSTSDRAPAVRAGSWSIENHEPAYPLCTQGAGEGAPRAPFEPPGGTRPLPCQRTGVSLPFAPWRVRRGPTRAAPWEPPAACSRQNSTAGPGTCPPAASALFPVVAVLTVEPLP